ncbi:MAG: molybdenum cofactor guanylyltransferase [Candidatus Latescibacterota bacterium]|mgnify:FL=1|nr:MAG: molybdenum cofactor guanylyltransferase [Candidatus Latescibacterota bacterium]
MVGVVLAGGRSSRMGMDKAGIVLGGRTLLERAIDALRPLCREVWVVGREGRDDGVRYLVDELPGLGPIGGLYTGLRALGDGRAIFVACDMPFLEPKLLEQLLGYNAEAVVFRLGCRVQPLPGVYDARLADRILGQVEAGERSLMALLRASRTAYVELPTSKARALLDVDTPEGLRRAEALLREEAWTSVG